MLNSCNTLHEERERAILQINEVRKIINSIANTPKEFETQMGQIRQEVLQFQQTTDLADEAMKAEFKSGVGILSGIAGDRRKKCVNDRNREYERDRLSQEWE